MAELIVRVAGKSSYRVSLETDAVRIGRSSKSEICLAGDIAISRLHAEISVTKGQYYVEDLGSRNGTFLDGVPIESKTPLLLGSRIRVGNAVITLVDSGAPDEPAPPEPLGENSIILSASQLVRGNTLPEGTVAGLVPEDESPHARAFSALSRWAPDLMTEQPLSEVLPVILEVVNQAITPDRAALLLLEGDPPALTPAASRGIQPGTDGSELISMTIAERVIGNQQSVLTSDARIDPRFKEAQSIAAQSVRSAMSVPLWNNHEVIGAIYVDRIGGLIPFSKVDLEVLTLLANLSAIKIDHVRLFERDQRMRELERELHAAAQIQRRLLPRDAPLFDGYDIHGSNDPCHAVGGDYFDFQPRGDTRLGVALGDVSGKGMGAALLMATLQASFRAHAATGVTPEKLVESLNRAVCANAEADKFITFFYGELDRESDTLHYVNAGHNPPMLFRSGGDLELLQTGGLILGFEPTMNYLGDTTTLAPGDVLLLFTDGVTEAHASDGEEFGEQRLAEIVRRSGDATATDIARQIRERVDAFTRGMEPFDDFTVCVIRRIE